MNALEVKELKKVYPEFTLDKVSFCVQQGHISGLIGRNGAGKSTTIKGILRLINAEGRVSAFGKDFLKEEMAVKQMIGYVGGSFRYYPMNTLVAIRKAYAPFYPTWNQNKYEKFLSQFELIESKKVKELSEGMKVKFALALALSHGAKLLIMDEPTSGLDPLSREEFCDIILQLVREEGVSVLFSTHITSDLMRIADDIVYISQGKILAACPLKELLDQYKLAHFSSLADATAANAIGVKSVKEGYEGLLPHDTQRLNGVTFADATIDNIIVHLEKANEEKRYAESD